MLSSRVGKLARRQRYGPRVRPVSGRSTVRLGSGYGGWVFEDTPQLHLSTIVSCGLGEDASFDVEFAARYGATVLLVDPTPRAVAHFAAIQGRFGLPSELGYSATGSQPVEAYDLRRVRPEQFILIPKAITDRNGPVEFFAPRNPEDVSYSVVNFQNDYSRTTAHIEVESITFPDLMAEVGRPEVSLVKLDIEGAEILAIPQMIRAGILPGQILIEFDELNRPSRRARANFDAVHGDLLATGYRPIHFDGRSCVSYTRS